VRRAAAQTAGELLDRSPSLRRAVETGDRSAGPLGEGIFCEIYRIFFADAVTGFFKAVITAKIMLMVPVLAVVDPAGLIADWIAKKVTSVIPTPCETKQDGGESLADLGRGLIKETVERALGISVEGQHE
jgi:hypothetical protein